MDKSSIGLKIKECREKLGLKQEELANMVGSSRTHISDMENGKKFMTLPLFIKLTEALKVSPDYLLSGCDKHFLIYAIDQFAQNANYEDEKVKDTLSIIKTLTNLE